MSLKVIPCKREITSPPGSIEGLAQLFVCDIYGLTFIEWKPLCEVLKLISPSFFCPMFVYSFTGHYKMWFWWSAFEMTCGHSNAMVFGGFVIFWFWEGSLVAGNIPLYCTSGHCKHECSPYHTTEASKEDALGAGQGTLFGWYRLYQHKIWLFVRAVLYYWVM